MTDDKRTEGEEEGLFSFAFQNLCVVCCDEESRDFYSKRRKTLELDKNLMKNSSNLRIKSHKQAVGFAPITKNYDDDE